jgi:hypothetical protein
MPGRNRPLAKGAKNDEGPAEAPSDGIYNITLAEALKELENVKWYWWLVEVEVEEHEGCLGPECSCWREEKK